MKIKRIELKNFGKYNEKSFSLKGINVIKGKNGAGKSTIIEAISYALTGEIRRLSKKGEDLIKMSNNGVDMSVTINSTTQDITRSLTKGKKISENLLVNGLDDKTNSEKQEILNEELSLNQSLLNPINFIGLSSTDKSKFLMEFVTNEVVTKETFLANLSKRVPKSVIDELEFNDDISLLDNIENFIKTTRANKRAISSTLTESINLREKLFDLEEQINSKNIDTNKIKELENTIISLKSEIKSNETALLKRKDLINRKEKIKKFLDENSEKQLDQEINQLTKKLESLNVDEDLNGLNKKIELEVKKLEQIKDTGTNLKNLTNSLCSEYNALAELESKVRNISSCKKCAIDSTIICMNDKGFNNALSEFNKKKQALRLSNQECKKKIVDKVNEYNNQLNVVNKLMATQKELQKRLSEKSKKTNEIIKKLQVLSKEKAKISNYKATLKEIENTISNYTNITDTTITQKLLNAKEAELSTLKAEQIELAKLQENRKLVAIEENKQEEINLKIEQLKCLEKALKIEKLSLIENGVKPLLKDINYILTGLNFPYNAFIKNDGKRAGIGLINNKKEIDISTLSTGETMILVIGLLNAIYNHNNAKFRPLFIDDIDNLDFNNLKSLLNNKEILKESFDTVIFMGVLENLELSDLEDINIIDLN